VRFGIGNWPLHDWKLSRHLSCDGSIFRVTNDGGAESRLLWPAFEAHTKENDRVANSGMVMRDVLQLRSGIPDGGATEGRMRRRVPST
jgi:hypothetical protein